MKHVAEFRRSDPLRAARIIRMSSVTASVSGIAISAAVAIMAEFLAARTMGAPQLAMELRIGSILLLLNTISGSQTGALSGLEAFGTIAAISTIRGLVNFPLMVAGAYFWGLPGAVAASAASAGVECVLNIVALRRVRIRTGIPLRVGQWRSEMPILWRFSVPVFVSSIITAPVDWLMGAVLVYRQEDWGLAELAIFGAASRWFNLALRLPGLLSQVTLPVLSNLWGEGRMAQYRKVLVVNSVLLTAAALVVAGPIAAASPWIMAAYGKGFCAGVPVLLLMCAVSVVYAGNMVVGQAIWASGASMAGMLLAAARSAIMVVSFMLLAGWGAMGIATAYLIAWVAQTGYQTPIVIASVRRGSAAAGGASAPIGTRNKGGSR
jgi:O-antigen/teichoic acid export membrane protein